jgi:N-carbamoyl-L-amino-acid hydrolase
MPAINARRLLDDLHRLRAFGATGNGVVRTSLSPVDVESRHWLAERYREAGLAPVIDGVGNVYGRSSKPGRALIVGSHSDTQPTGGWLDGALGVIYGLEIARAMHEDAATRDLAIDAVSWMDEEGTFLGCLGARSFCGVLEDEAVASAANAQGQSLGAALAAAGLADAPRVMLEPERHLGYLEAHVEQGPYLEAGGKRIGVVSSIVGIRGYTVEFLGQQNHAGTTPMPMRRDAGMALLEFGHQVNQRFKRLCGDRTVWTVGQVQFQPGASSIIPGRAIMQLQMRDPDQQRLDDMERAAEELAQGMSGEGPVAVDFQRNRAPVAPTIMDAGFREHIAAAAEAHLPGGWQTMPSAAGHDPMVLSHHLPCAMLFIPSIGGISHDFAEDSHEADIVLGAQVLADAAASIARGA